jgi:hypothetical protein
MEEIKVFISQPMKDKTNEEIESERKVAIDTIKAMYPGRTVTIIDSFFKDAPHDAAPLWFLGKSLELLSTANIAYFCKGWEKYRGCKMERMACDYYGIRYFGE